MIKKSMKSCALNLAIDGSEDTLIPSLKEGQPCHSGMSMLKQQIEFLNEPSIDPFLFDENDVDTATPEFLLIDDNEDKEELIDID